MGFKSEINKTRFKFIEFDFYIKDDSFEIRNYR